eukprot:c10020_g1_i1.p1 GENE.c10020_g1_i1~~c10020_g1_i1.p1  ORF type:complete len:122 (+),score=41.69 c10020_g1_i1:34-366(+)
MVASIPQMKERLEKEFQRICGDVIKTSEYSDANAKKWREDIVHKAEEAVRKVVHEEDYKVFMSCVIVRKTSDIGYVKSHSSLCTEEDLVAKIEFVGGSTIVFLDCILAAM